jgi:hypothetical protein
MIWRYIIHWRSRLIAWFSSRELRRTLARTLRGQGVVRISIPGPLLETISRIHASGRPYTLRLSSNGGSDAYRVGLLPNPRYEQELAEYWRMWDSYCSWLRGENTNEPEAGIPPIICSFSKRVEAFAMIEDN